MHTEFLKTTDGLFLSACVDLTNKKPSRWTSMSSEPCNCPLGRCLRLRSARSLALQVPKQTLVWNFFLAPSLNCSCFDVLGCASVQCLVVIGKDVGVCSQFPNKARVFHNDLFIFTKTLSSALADVCVSRLLLTESSLRILISAVCYVHFNNCIGGHKTPQLFSPYISSSMTNRWSVRLRPVCRAPVIFAC